MKLTWRADFYERDGFAAYYRKLYVGSLLFHEDPKYHAGCPWRGWFHCHEDDGRETGWFPTKEEAQASVEAAFREAIAELGEALMNTGRRWSADEEVALRAMWEASDLTAEAMGRILRVSRQAVAAKAGKMELGPRFRNGIRAHGRIGTPGGEPGANPKGRP